MYYLWYTLMLFIIVIGACAPKTHTVNLQGYVYRDVLHNTVLPDTNTSDDIPLTNVLITSGNVQGVYSGSNGFFEIRGKVPDRTSKIMLKFNKSGMRLGLLPVVISFDDDDDTGKRYNPNPPYIILLTNL